MLNFKNWKLVLLVLACMAQLGSAQFSEHSFPGVQQEVKLRNASQINTASLEFSPAYYQNGIVFASSRFKAGKRDEQINETFFELFYSETDGNGEPLSPRPFSMEVNSFLHEGPVTFNRAGNRIFFTRNNIQKGLKKADQKGVVRLKIYEAKKGVYDWEHVKALPFNNDAYSCAHPTLSADETRLYFASDRPGGYGGMDIWVVERKGSLWSEPINLGPEINTPQNEVFPFIHNSGYLIFSSNGHKGIGGLDLFMISMKSEDQKLIHLGRPYNSDEDDLGLILNTEGTNGYFSSARSGGMGKDDIYLFEARDGIMGLTRPEIFASLISVHDAKNQSKIEGAALRVFEKTSSGFLGGDDALYETVLMTAKNNSSELVFKLIRKGAGQLGEPDRMTDPKGTTTYPFKSEKEYIVLVTKEGYQSKEVTITLSDNLSRDPIRISLEQENCSPLVGVVRNKLTNELLPGAIVKFWNGCTGVETAVYANEQGQFEFCLEPHCDYVMQGVKENFSGELIKMPASELNGHSLEKEILLEPVSGDLSVATGTVIVLENIYYDFNKSHIRVGAARELQELLFMMQQYPSMMIELISHTDSRGSWEYNLALSQRRAEAAKEFLTGRGINSNRIRAVGNGESEPRNKCVDGVRCSEEDHQYNRRTEVRVIGIEAPIHIRYGNKLPGVIDRRGRR